MADDFRIDMVITNPDGQKATATAAFTFESAPTITSIVPNHGPASGGTVVTITGTNFKMGATVLFGTKPALNVTVSSTTTIVCTTPSMV